MNYTVLTILPSGAYDLIRTNNQLMDFDTMIGPIVDPDDIEKAIVYYIYCKIDNTDNENFINTTLTKIIQRKYNELKVYGQAYILKVVDKKSEDVIKNDTDLILGILQTLFNDKNQPNVIKMSEGRKRNKNNDDNEQSITEWLMECFCM